MSDYKKLCEDLRRGGEPRPPRLFPGSQWTGGLVEDELSLKAAKAIEDLQAETDSLFYTLAGVMHFVDKWLDEDELKQPEILRAAAMREKLLKIVEQSEDCQSCAHHIPGRCDTFCDHGESYKEKR